MPARLRWIAVAVALTGCGRDAAFELAPITLYRISGTAEGVPADGLELRLANERLAILRDGPFQFTTELAEGVDFELEVSRVAATHGCEVDPRSGTMPARDISDVRVRCRPFPLDTCPTFDQTAWRQPLLEGRPATVGVLDRLPDGRVVAIGAVIGDAGPTPAIWRWHPSGARDVGLGPGGMTTIAGAPSFTPTAAWRDAARTFIVGTQQVGLRIESYLIAVDDEGRLDPTFGAMGAVALRADPGTNCENPGGAWRTVVDVVPAADDGLWVVGEWSTPCQVTRPWIGRVAREEGRAEIGIYEEGMRFLWPIQTPRFDDFPKIRAALPVEGGGLIVAGNFWTLIQWEGALRLLDENGITVLSFGNRGVAALPRPDEPASGFSHTNGYDVIRDSEGHLLVTGRRRLFGQANPTLDGDETMVWRLQSNGQPDPSFGTQGYLRIPNPMDVRLPRDMAHSITTSADGQIVLGGWRDTPEGLTVAAARLEGAGIDARVGRGGVWTDPSPSESEWTGPTLVQAGEDGCVWWASNVSEPQPMGYLGAFRTAPPR